MALNPEIVEKHFEKIEKIAEETLSDQQEIRCLDKRCNKNREALRQLQTNPNCCSSKSWVCVGNLFIRLPTHEVKTNIEQEQEKLKIEINSLRNGLREKVDHLNKLEGKPITRGSGLTALGKEEWQAVKQVLGYS
ncbi:UNVERIFIED_CONTAM: hypothetical protein RMT77_008361 [Armadillidium vulgare]|nr:p53 and DNA damage-regulated protein 1 [Armadillidium vulgare]